jgi:hypothetical protein
MRNSDTDRIWRSTDGREGYYLRWLGRRRRQVLDGKEADESGTR